MNIFIALAAGAALGWITFSFMSMNGARGNILSMVIGGMGGVMGSKMVAPLFAGAPSPTGDFSAVALLCAIAGAAALLYTSHMISSKWDI